MVAELDESDGSFEKFHPNIAVVTNADWDHVNHYPTFESVLEAFGRFTSNPKDGGLLVLCGEDAGLGKIMASGPLPREAVTYGWGMGWTWGAFNVRHNHGGGASFSIAHRGVHIDDMELSVSGDHNILNALAACAVAHTLEFLHHDQENPEGIKGAKRRLQHLGQINGVEVYDDYGHHPREIAATLSAIGRMFPEKRLLVAFQPHRFTRTQALYRDFASVLSRRTRYSCSPSTRRAKSRLKVFPPPLSILLNEKGYLKSVMCGSLRKLPSSSKNSACPVTSY